MRAEDLLVAVFPEQLACQDNAAPGPIEMPDHPLVRETLRDCLTEAMDIDGLRAVLDRARRRRDQRVARETPEPSVFAHEILNANPYAFLDDAPLEERRARAVTLRRGLPASVADDVGRLDPAAIAAVVDEAWPDLRDADELHDLLLDLGALPERDGDAVGRLSRRPDRGRARGAAPPRRAASSGSPAERRSLAATVWPARALRARPGRAARAAGRRVVRSRRRAGRDRAGAARAGRPDHRGGARDGARPRARRGGRGAGRGRGRGRRAPRALHARGHRGRAGRVVRAPAARAHPSPHPRRPAPRSSSRCRPPCSCASSCPGSTRGPRRSSTAATGSLRVIERLQGFEAAAGVWERDLLPSRVAGYEPGWLDELCLSGEVAWGRLGLHESARHAGRRLSATVPVALLLRRDLAWLLAPRPAPPTPRRTGRRRRVADPALGPGARRAGASASARAPPSWTTSPRACGACASRSRKRSASS